jgi:mRNA interferase MazF
MKRGEVWMVNLDPTIGAEIQKTRPAVILSNDAMGRLPLRIIVPITSWDERFKNADWHVKLPVSKKRGLKKDSSADTFQVRSVSNRRLVKKIGVLDPSDMQKIAEGLRIVMELE